MHVHLFDHLMVAVLVAVMPFYAVWVFRKVRSKVAAGITSARRRAYQGTIIEQWVLAAAVLAIWMSAGRDWDLLGLNSGGGWGWWIGCIAAMVVGVVLILQTGSIMKSEEKIESVRQQIEPLRDILPHSPREGRWFTGLSVTAGICEELLYRGFLIAYIASILNVWAAVLISSVIFGFGHIYQGTQGAFKSGVSGLVMAVLYLLTGSLWVPMLLHALIDINSGVLTRRIIEYTENPPGPFSD